ncbi:ORF21 [White spot syndrome virus]|uniref:Wsv475 n=3 Tax=White spot syndrome virus TaxID=342409 RepID=Q77IZ2_WSSVS|nr:wsv475 [Shrimp white spot syndrome virus]AAK77689.1 ORF20 [White spot syndrome virus]AAK77690.1 ORF21 [White spot syndrome virus]AAL33476.1 wsv475 [Shrimp white spot syndrome virus]AAL88870.1 WSSV002 [Shrimp white spot syndrome virus]ALZ45680.1 hypothetical protein [White spot syndrome virus]
MTVPEMVRIVSGIWPTQISGQPFLDRLDLTRSRRRHAFCYQVFTLILDSKTFEKFFELTPV